MSTDESSNEPLTRAELRAQRAAQEQRVAQEQRAAQEQPASEHMIASTPIEEVPLAEEAHPVEEAQPLGDTAPAKDTRPAARTPVDRRFILTLVSVLGVLALVVGVLSAISLVQGPRLSQVQVDAAQVIESSGSRVILTANQRLDDIDAAQVTVEPAVPFTVDAAGRSIGIRFSVPLRDSTKYRVSVTGAAAAGGGPKSELTTTFTTPASRFLLLQRVVDGDDTIFSTDLDGDAAPVFAHPRIDDYRATPEHIAVAVEEEGGSRLIVMNRDGSGQRELPLPGEGFVSSVQVSDRAGLVGYTYSDRELTETSGRASVLVTQALRADAEPRIVQSDGVEASVAEWRFIPDSSSLLFIDFNGALSVEDPTGDAGRSSMGIAASILGVSGGTHTAIVERTDASIVELDLADGAEQPLTASEPDYGDATDIAPFPGGTLRHIVQRDEAGTPTGQAVVRVDEDGTARIISEVSGTDAIVQTCVSPSGQYAAVVIAPDLPRNDYDDLLLPLPTTLHTQLIDMTGQRTLPTLNGFDISWCRSAPQP